MSDEYHEYVVCDGELVGAFDEMYQECDDPWKQDQIEPLAEDILLLLFHRSELDVDSVLDLGCGKGRFTNRLSSVMSESTVGLDISPTAVKTARCRYDTPDFLVAEVPPIPFESDAFNVVVVAELLWYVLNDISYLFTEIERVLRDDGRCYLIQQYYDPKEQSYGNETMEKPSDIFPYIPMELVNDIRIQDSADYKWVAHFCTTD